MSPLLMTTGMMTSFSLPGLPSLFNLRIPFVSGAAEVWAIPDEGNTAEVIPRTDSTEAKRIANILRVRLRFMCMLLFNSNVEL